MPLAILIIPGIICFLYGFYKGSRYTDESVKKGPGKKSGVKWR